MSTNLLTIYDSVNPDSIPNKAFAAVYVNGAFFARPDQLTRFKRYLWIDVNGSDPVANALDIETGDATPDAAPDWVKAHVDHYGIDNPNVHARLYVNFSNWGAAKSAVGSLDWKYRSHIKWWVANPTGRPHIVPGAHATQWDWRQTVDVSLAYPGFI